MYLYAKPRRGDEIPPGPDLAACLAPLQGLAPRCAGCLRLMGLRPGRRRWRRSGRGCGPWRRGGCGFRPWQVFAPGRGIRWCWNIRFPGFAPFPLLAMAGLLQLCDAEGRTRGETDPLMQQWEAHDLAFHARSRMGLHDRTIGGTFRFKGQLPPTPALPEPPPHQAMAQTSLPAAVITLGARHSRVAWKYTGMAYATQPKNAEIGLGPSARRAITRQLRDALNAFYVHLQQKVAATAINPERELDLLADVAGLFVTNRAHFDRLLNIFCKRRDRHTGSRRPPPWSQMIACLPLVRESCFENRRRCMMVTMLTGPLEDLAFQAGVEVTHRNGTDIGRFIERLSRETSGATPSARIALAQRSVT